jgi:uroporphyrin-III C-methyltransferase / precorrin-2 dehydrogenase / sirohydrochlorin ferrochelatase
MSVYLVGAGPGDPSLLTIKALQAIQKADVILYDKLVSTEILSLARRDAVLEDVGKRRGSCPVPQDEICARLVELGKQGKVVCRLKGGDPYLFGRGGEEAIALANAGIDPIVIPGVTSASAIAAATGIPLTHREIARSVRFITGHLALQKYIDNWPSLIAENETAVIYMGFSHIKNISRSFLKAGSDPGTPVAAIQNGTLENQKVVITTLEKVLTEDIFLYLKDGPILLIIGKVVTLRNSIKKVQRYTKSAQGIT